ncbi:MAG: hypothetical protein AAF845_18780 [Bacteroidota bacterium]
MFRALVLAVLVPLSVAGCASTALGVEPAAPAGPEAASDTLRLGVGETAARDGHTLLFVGVAEDSRCPEDVECVRPGIASVHVEVDGETVVLTLSAADLEPGQTSTAPWGEATIEAVGLTPYPGSEADRRRAPITAVFVRR